MRWVGTWVLNNASHALHGRSGTSNVEAESQSEAVQKVRDEASRQLFDGSTLMQAYIEIRSLIQATG